MKNKIYTRPFVKFYTYLTEDSIASSSSAAVSVGDTGDPNVPKMEEFIPDNSFSTPNYQEI